MPLFVGDLIAATQELTMEQLGCYVSILMTTWAKGGKPFPDDNGKLGRICRMSRTKFERNIRPALLPYFDLSGGTWRQHRLEKEWAYVAERAARARANGVNGGRPPAESVSCTKTDEKIDETGSRNFPENDLFSSAKSLKSLKTENPVGSSWDTQTESPQPQPHKESKKEESMEAKPPGQVSLDDLFERFWKACPSRGPGLDKGDKKKTRVRFKALVKGSKGIEPVDPEQIIQGAELYSQMMRDKGKWGTETAQQAMTILNRETWKLLLPDFVSDDEAPATPSELWALRLADFMNRGKWERDWGPPPVQDGCMAPANLIEDAWAPVLERYEESWCTGKGLYTMAWPGHLGPRPGDDLCRVPQDALCAAGTSFKLKPAAGRVVHLRAVGAGP